MSKFNASKFTGKKKKYPSINVSGAQVRKNADKAHKESQAYFERTMKERQAKKDAAVRRYEGGGTWNI